MTLAHKTLVHKKLSRRLFLERTGTAALAASVAGALAPASRATGSGNPLPSDRKIRIGVVGGGFGSLFAWNEHPNCIVQAVSDLRTDRREKLMKVYQCDRSYESLEKLILDEQVEAVAVFTGAPDHVRHCVAVMNAGKHAISAVPAAMSIKECEQLLEAKIHNDRKYMMAETSYYRAYAIAARELYQQGKFGELFYSEVEYYHPQDEAAYRRCVQNGKRTWRYGFPPMHYPTHSTGYLVGVTRERLTEVSCLGCRDPEDIYSKDRDNAYDNPFSASAGMFKTDRNHMCRVNVFWCGVAHGERAQWFGTKLALYMPGSGGQPFSVQGQQAPAWKNVPSYLERLPKAMQHATGHGGSHVFLAHEFISALVEEREPAIDIYESLAMTAPGIVAHQSALKGGEQLKIPSFDKKA